jgi:hypothetical protein
MLERQWHQLSGCYSLELHHVESSSITICKVQSPFLLLNSGEPIIFLASITSIPILGG